MVIMLEIIKLLLIYFGIGYIVVFITAMTVSITLGIFKSLGVMGAVNTLFVISLITAVGGLVVFLMGGL